MSVFDSLPTLDGPYPGVDPWYDVSAYLRNGVEVFAPGSVAVQVIGNTIEYSIRCRTNNAEPGAQRIAWFTDPELRPAVNMSAIAEYGDYAAPVSLTSGGSFEFPGWSARRLGDAGTLGVTIRARRSA